VRLSQRLALRKGSTTEMAGICSVAEAITIGAGPSVTF
jgi:hypothetical protein